MFKPSFKISGGMEWLWVGAAALFATQVNSSTDKDNFGEGQNFLPVATVAILTTKLFELVFTYYSKVVELGGKSIQGQLKEALAAREADRVKFDARSADQEERIQYILAVAKKREADYEQRIEYLYHEREEFAKERADFRAADEAKTRTIVSLHEKFMDLTARVVMNNAALLAGRLTAAEAPEATPAATPEATPAATPSE